jgi:hypothetical protein
MAVATLAVARPITLALLNAADAYASTPTSDKYTAAEIDEALFQGDEQVALNVLSTVGHFARSNFLALSADIAHGAKIPEHVGDIGQILIKRWTSDTEYKPGIPTTEDAIARYRANIGVAPYNMYGALAHDAPDSPLSGYYCLKEENILLYTGVSAKAYIANYVRTAALQSPAIYIGAIVAYAPGLLFQKDGADPQAAAYYMTLAQNMFAQIRGEAKALPDLTPFARAA